MVTDPAQKDHFTKLVSTFEKIQAYKKKTFAMIQDMTVSARKAVEQVAERQIEQDPKEFLRRESFAGEATALPSQTKRRPHTMRESAPRLL